MKFTRNQTMLDAACLIAVPLFAALFCAIHMGPSSVDSWLYYAYGTDFRPLLASYGWTYYAARLPWVMLIKAYFIPFSPGFALFLLGMTVCSVGSISLYSILHNYYARSVAFIAAFTFAANIWWISHGFWLYVDGPAIALSLLCIATTIRGTRNARLPTFAVAGALFAIGINVHPVVVFLVLPAVSLILMADLPRLRWRVIGWAAAFLTGSALTAVAICAAAWAAFGNFWFFLTSVETTERVVSGGWAPWVLPFTTWIVGATAFFVPAGLLIVALPLFAREAVRRKSHRDTWVIVYASFLALCVAFSDGILHAGRLQHSYYFIYLWVPSFLLLGAVLNRLDRQATIQATIAAISITLGVLLLSGLYWSAYADDKERLMLGAYVASGVLFVAMVATVWLSNRRLPYFLGLLATVGFVSVASATDYRLIDVSWLRPDTTLDFRTTVDAQRFIANQVQPNRRLLMWYSAKSRGISEFTAINSTFLYLYSQLDNAMPTLTSDGLARMQEPSTIVLLATDQHQIDQAFSVLQARGFVEHVVAKTAIGAAERRVIIWVVDARSAADAEYIAGQSSVAETPARLLVPLRIDWSKAWIQGTRGGSQDAPWPVSVHVPDVPWTYGAVLPFDAEQLSPGRPFVLRIRAIVSAGKVGLGVLNRKQTGVVDRTYLLPSSTPSTVTLTVPDPGNAGPLLVQNYDDAITGDLTILGAEALVRLSSAPMTVDEQRIELPQPRGAFPLQIETPARAGAEAAVIPCQLPPLPPGTRRWIRVRARVVAGEASFGLTTGPGHQVSERSNRSSANEIQTIMLETNSEAGPLDLVIESSASGVPATVIVDSIDAATLP